MSRTTRTSRTTRGRHEHGQNFLTDPLIVAAVVERIDRTHGPILEIGPGDGAITGPLVRLGRPLTAIELDARWVRRLRDRFGDRVDVVHGSYLRARHPGHPHVVVGNVPFHITTAVMRRLLPEPAWTEAVLLVQWEVARRRAGVGGSSLLTAQWWPWYEFRLLTMVPARAFDPAPSVDGGLLHVVRRRVPLVGDRDGYQRFAHRVFSGRGRGLPEILRRGGRFDRTALDAWLGHHGVTSRTLPPHLTAEQWASLWDVRRQSTTPVRSTGSATSSRSTRGRADRI